MSLKCTISPCKSCKNDCAFKGHENDFEICKGYITTNGDIIKAMFPNAQIDYHKQSDLVDDYVTVFIKGCDTCQDYSYDWWNEPYKIESEEK